MKKIPLLIALALCLCIACEKEKSQNSPVAESPDSAIETGEKPESHDEIDEHDDSHEHTEGVHLGEHMYEISRRFSALWFAGKAGNAAMVKYQTHELEEVIEELEETRPEEAGVDVVARLKSDIEVHFEKLEEAAEKGDSKAFESSYREAMNNCTVCHADTKHPFIQVKVPEYNPYPNLAF